MRSTASTGRGRRVTSRRSFISFAYYDVDAGASIHTHSHDEEEVWHIVEGTLEITIDAETVVRQRGNRCGGAAQFSAFGEGANERASDYCEPPEAGEDREAPESG